MSLKTSEIFEFAPDELSIASFFFSTLPERADDRLVVGLILIPVLYGLFANFVLIFTVIRSKELMSNPSYYLLIHIAVCDLAILHFEAFYRLGGIVFRQAFLVSAHSTLNYTIHFFRQCFWWSFVFGLTFTALNRFVCIFFIGRFDGLLTRRTMIFLVLCSSVFGVLMSTPHLSSCCRVTWLFDQWTTSYYPHTTWFLQFDFVVTLITIGTITVSYLGVGWRFMQMQATATENKHRNQLLLALQVGVISGIYILNSVMWNVVPYIEASKWSNAAFASTSSIQCAIHPTIAFIFNERIRKALMRKMSKNATASINVSSSRM